MDKLKDIQAIVAIPDNSLIYLMLLVFIVLTLIIVIIYFVRKKLKNQDLDKKFAIQQLKNLDFNNAKLVAYRFYKYSFAITNDDNLQKIAKINAALENYKYKKSVANLDENLIIKIQEVLNATI